MTRRSKKLTFTKQKAVIGILGVAILATGIVAGAEVIGPAIERANKQTSSPLKPGSGEAQDKLVVAWLPDTVKRWKPQIEKYAKLYEVDPNLLAIMMTIESGGDPNAESGVAKGLMQVTDPTAGDIAKRYLHTPVATYDLKNPETSIEFGAAYVHYLIRQLGNAGQAPSWDETVTLVASGYNGGLKAAHAYEMQKWNGLENYDHQTFSYARYVRVMWQERHDPLSFAYRYWYDVAHGETLVKNAERYKR